jgi:FKBP-type peptidyl-prolyl cis-trans isomerase
MKDFALHFLLAACGALSACSDASKNESGESSSLSVPTAASDATPTGAATHAEPSTLDKGDGCTVLLLEPGRGDPARIGDEMTIDYVARVKDAETPFASTASWNTPCRVTLGASNGPRVVPGLARGLEGLRAGARATITVPPALAYGKAGLPSSGIPADATLVFEVEVSGVRR